MPKTISANDIPAILKGSDNFRDRSTRRNYLNREAEYMGSVLLPRPTDDGKFLTFDVLRYLREFGVGYTFTIPGTNTPQMCSFVGEDNVIHIPCDVPIQSIGLGSACYYTTIAMSSLTMNRFSTDERNFGYVRSLPKHRTPDATEWWDRQLVLGRAEYGPIPDEDDTPIEMFSFESEDLVPDERMRPTIAAAHMYLWRIGSVPSWLTAGPVGNSVHMCEQQSGLEQLKYENRVFASERSRILSNLYPSAPGVAEEGIRLSASNLGYLSSVMKPSIYFPKGMEDYTL